jgi:hypothetical protein
MRALQKRQIKLDVTSEAKGKISRLSLVRRAADRRDADPPRG